MSLVDVSLPEGFQYLERFAAVWGSLETQEARYLQRQRSSMQELKEFYDAAAPGLEEIFSHLDRFPAKALPAPEKLLYQTALGLTEAAMAIEVFNQPRVPYAPYPHHVEIRWGKGS